MGLRWGMVGGFTGWGNRAGAGTISGGSSVASEMGWKHTPALIPKGRDCHSRLGSFAMTGLVFFSFTSRGAEDPLETTKDNK